MADGLDESPESNLIYEKTKQKQNKIGTSNLLFTI